MLRESTSIMLRDKRKNIGQLKNNSSPQQNDVRETKDNSHNYNGFC